LLQRGLGAGAIFALKNFGWIDELKYSAEIKVTMMPDISIGNRVAEYQFG
jgi:hypothetical protein